MPSSIISKGDVVLVPFPFTDLSSAKQRPALVISPAWLESDRGDVILVALTTQIPNELAPDEYKLSQADLRMANLPAASMVRAGKIFTLEKKKIHKRLGKVSPGTFSAVYQKLQELFSPETSARQK